MDQPTTLETTYIDIPTEDDGFGWNPTTLTLMLEKARFADDDPAAGWKSAGASIMVSDGARAYDFRFGGASDDFEELDRILVQQIRDACTVSELFARAAQHLLAQREDFLNLRDVVAGQTEDVEVPKASDDE